MTQKPARRALFDRLSRREREIVNVLFAAGNRATAEEIRAGLDNPPTSSAVRAMLARLEAKGVLRRAAEGLRYVYSATTSPASAQRDALRQYLRVFFGGSREALVTTLLTQEPWTPEELDVLQAQIDRIRKERSRS